MLDCPDCLGGRYFGGINSASFAPQDSNYTGGQPWAGVVTATNYTPFIASNPDTSGVLELDAQAGRKDSPGPAAWFNQQAPVFISADSTQSQPVIDNLNFAFTGELTINGTTYLVALGQGNEGGGSSPWWLGGQGYTVASPPSYLPSKPVLVTPDGQYWFQSTPSDDVFFVCSVTSPESSCSPG